MDCVSMKISSLTSYKNGVANGFIDYVSAQFVDWKSNPQNEDEIFKINFASSQMKPIIPSFVDRVL